MPDPKSPPDPPSAPPAAPWTDADLLSVWRRPYLAADVLLTHPQRLGATVARRPRQALLAATLLVVSLVFAAPFGLVLGPDKAWRVAALFVGALAVCFPSLHVFSAFLGRHVDVRQDLTLALTISAVAALFAAGFAPVIWFLDLTMGDGVVVGARQVGGWMLGFCLLAGLVHQGRCMQSEPTLRASPGVASLLLVWHALLAFVTVRLAWALDLP